MKYNILYDVSIDGLIKQVNEYLKKGWGGWMRQYHPIKTLFCVKSITYLNIVWDVNLKVISSFH